MAKAVARKKGAPYSLRQKAYDDLKTLILTGQVRPSERLSESRLAERLGVSRTPLREALMKLEEEGLVVGQRNLGYVVTDLDVTAVCDLLIVRQALDVCAAELACARATDEDFDRISDIIKQMEALRDRGQDKSASPSQDLDLGLQIHKVIAAATRNDALIRATDQIYQQLQMALWLEVLLVDFEDSDLAEHKAIANAILARNAPAAAEAARDHVQGSLRNMTKVQEMLRRRQMVPRLVIPR
ncbi:MAG: GntR family transcriptional regulator [Pseudomonadota bacterium]